MRRQIEEILDKRFGHGKYILDGLGDGTLCECDLCMHISEATDQIMSLIRGVVDEGEITGIIADVMVKITKNDFTAPVYFMREEEIAHAISQHILERLGER